jgi:phage-related protein
MDKYFEHIAYDGAYFTIEWYFDTKHQSQALEYYQALSDDERIKILKLFKRMGDAGEIKDKTKFMNEGNKIYAFKPQPERFLCFFYEEQKIIITNAFRKKQQKLPKNEKEKALNRRDNYIIRTRAGEYYD